MHVVVTAGGTEREAELVLDDADATVGDLLAVVAPGRADAPVLVDGRPVLVDHRLDEIGLVEGARLDLGPAASPPPVALPAGQVVAVVGGIDAGRSVALAPGLPVAVGRHPDGQLVLQDPSVSARHARLEVTPDGRVLVSDLGSSNGTVVDGVVVAGPTEVPAGSIVGVGETQLQVRAASADDRPVGSRRAGVGGVVPFNRPPRPAVPEARPLRAAPDAPGEGGRRTPFNVAMVVAPLVMGGVMIAITGEPRFALFIMLSPVMAVGSWWSQRRQAKKDSKTTTREHRAAIEALDRDLRDDAEAERRRRAAALPDPAEVVRRALLPSVKLWERRPAHADVLLLRAGLGAVPWSGVEASPSAEHPLLAEVRARHDVLRRCPVEVDLSGGGVVGIVGHRETALAVARSLLCQAVVGQGPADLPVAVCTSEAHAASWDWAKWLPHVRDPAGAFRLLAGDRDTADSLLGAMLAATDDDPRAYRPRDEAAGPSRLLVLDDITLLEGRKAPARTLLAGTSGRCAGIVLAPTEDQLPAVCNTVIVAPEPGGIIEVRRPFEGVRLTGVVPAGISVPVAREVARALARWEDPELSVAGAGLPAMVRLLPLLGLDDPDPAAILERWSANPVDPPPATPIGMGERGAVVIDLATDGPHTLIGGTTGSGKSELLRSLVAGLAAGNDPDHLVFVLVDYKGGSAFDECARLPHTVGMVTDLDESLGERALRSLEAELRRRERVLREAGTQDLPAYLAARSPLGPLPRLVVVVDEFATLATELPDFLGALVGVAQRGRSLGVHLVLATQRPQGAVNANIKANTNLRIALRVQDQQDSTDIIDRPDAASISRTTPGRAQVRSGPGEVEAVQTALSTAGAPGGPARPVRALPFPFGPSPVRMAPSGEGDDRPSDLHLLVEALIAAVQRQGHPEPVRPWLPMLDDELPFEAVLAAAAEQPDADPGVLTFALADEPDHQRQVPVGWRLADGHLVISGMVGSGTSTTLLSVGRALAERWTADDLHLYGIDFGAGSLAPLAHLPNTGSVIGAVDREGQIRLVRHLRAELDRRRGLAPAEQAAEPRVVVLIDGAAGFLAEHEAGMTTEVMDALRRLFGEGPGVGILFAVAGERMNALPQRVSGTIDQRIVLRLPDPVDYSQIGVRLREAPKIPPGRGWHSNGPLVLQVGHPGDLEAVGSRLADRQGPATRPPRPMGSLPVDVSVAQLGEAGAHLVVGPLVEVPIGIGDTELAPAFLRLHRGDHAVVAGPARSGKTSALVAIATQLAAHDGVITVAVCDEGSPLRDVPGLDAHGTVEFLAEVLRAAPGDTRPWFVFVDDAIRVPDHEGVLSSLFTSGRADLHVLVAARCEELRSTLTHWTRPARAGRTGLLIQPDLQLDADIFTTRLPRQLASALRPGRGFVVTSGELELAQLARA
ncbi:FHA domain-containing protein [Aquihabitans sp. G128]|uniref:FtsK/SpoIIIE domain-containing protein n=1 Tax=Aquihabitans sp. G128 TaxID=2849779 RepID=UPI001C2120E2|nr:FtsK/SpoIIIE domain-containing protein [Aquihabitans sp. G128]QXC61417.1 FHA domain-containing protein [Aquihabitans sp. G128]